MAAKPCSLMVYLGYGNVHSDGPAGQKSQLLRPTPIHAEVRAVSVVGGSCLGNQLAISRFDLPENDGGMVGLFQVGCNNPGDWDFNERRRTRLWLRRKEGREPNERLPTPINAEIRGASRRSCPRVQAHSLTHSPSPICFLVSRFRCKLTWPQTRSEHFRTTSDFENFQSQIRVVSAFSKKQHDADGF
jgi:hypothetical protein